MLSGDSGGELKATHRRLRLKFDEAFYGVLRLETIVDTTRVIIDYYGD